jgi:hypothetical protein
MAAMSGNEQVTTLAFDQLDGPHAAAIRLYAVQADRIINHLRHALQLPHP